MDPAHSLSDIFDIDIGGHPKRISDHLFAYEPDLEEEARASFAGIKTSLLPSSVSSR